MLLSPSCNFFNKITDEPPVITFDNGTGVYSAKVNERLTITPVVSNAIKPKYVWVRDGETVAESLSYEFVSDTVGTFYLTFSVTAENGSASEDVRVEVSESAPPSVALPSQDGIIYAVVGKKLEIVPDVLRGEGAEYLWKLDGAVVSRDATYSFSKTAAGDYSLSLEVANDDGTGSDSATVRVGEAPGMSLFFDVAAMTVPLGRTLALVPYIRNEKAGALYRWEVDGQTQAGEAERKFRFTPSAQKTYTVKVTASFAVGDVSASVEVACTPPDGTYIRSGGASAYSDKVWEFRPAPGQFVNENYTAADMEQACGYAQRVLSGNYTEGKSEYVSLGGFGGYIVVGFDHSVPNGAGADFTVKGNAYAGSSEPGVVWVMQDENGNGSPDDTWYELKGSEEGEKTTVRRYSVTYFRPAAGHNVRWTDNLGGTGYIERTVLHTQDSYYPAWVGESHYTLRGTCLGLRNSYDPASGFWTNAEYDWGYADNLGSDTSEMETSFDIGNAVQADGSAVSLGHIDFVKVQTGVNGKSGSLGEISTEVLGFRDLHYGD